MSRSEIASRAELWPDARARRQAVRGLIQADQPDFQMTETLLRRCLVDDPDWEVRATAMLGVGRLRVRALGRLVRAVELPQTSREGLDPTDRRILRALRDACLGLLRGQLVPPSQARAPGSREEMEAHLLTLVADAPTAWHDQTFLMVRALTCPMPSAEPLPASLPEAIVATPGGYRLARTAIDLIWVPALPHWLGDHASADSRIREVRPRSGFFIAAKPLPNSVCVSVLASPDTALAADPADSFLADYQTATSVCAALAAVEGASVALPTADEWEMAARGVDGRRFPWGQGLERDLLQKPSAWGALQMVGCVPQWTASPADPGSMFVCGGPERLRCADRSGAPAQSSRAAVRPVLAVK
jgi:hypothetical protein